MKLKNKIISGLLLLGTSVGLSSCADFLDQVNPNEVTSSSFYSSIADCESSLAAVYNALKDTDCYRLKEEMERSDIAVEGGWDAGRSVYDDPCYLQTFNNNESACIEKWEALYKVIFRANQLIEGLEKYESSLDESSRESWNQMMGEALFIRGLVHFWLSELYNEGKIILVSEVAGSSEESLYMPLTEDIDEVRAFYRADMEAALEYDLPESWSDTQKGRVTLGAVKTYLGQSYLYEGDYATALTYFKDVIDSGTYSLAPVGYNNGTLNEFNSESIFEINYTIDYNTEMSGDQKLSNTWHTTFGRVGTVYYQVFPAAWFAYLLTYGDEVDQDNPDNWVEVEVDEDENVKYTYLGVSYDYTTTYSDGTYDINSYVFRKYDEDTQATEIENYGPYSRNIVRVKRSYEADGTTDSDDNTYTNLQAAYGSVIIKEEDGVYYRLKTYTPRASHKLALPTDENELYYGDYTSYIALYQSGHLGYWKEFTNHDIYTTENDSSAIGYSGINQRLMTLSDVYLMYAECLVETGGSTTTVLEYINKLRYRGGATLLGTTGEYAGVAGYDGLSYSLSDLREQIRFVERPIEVGMGQATRVCDLRRWGITKSRFTELAATTYIYGPCVYPYPATTAYGSTTGYGLSAANYRWGAKIYTADDFAFLQSINSWLGYLTCADYTAASVNYTYENNAYWPISSEEIQNNPNLN